MSSILETAVGSSTCRSIRRAGEVSAAGPARGATDDRRRGLRPAPETRPGAVSDGWSRCSRQQGFASASSWCCGGAPSISRSGRSPCGVGVRGGLSASEDGEGHPDNPARAACGGAALSASRKAIEALDGASLPRVLKFALSGGHIRRRNNRTETDLTDRRESASSALRPRARSEVGNLKGARPSEVEIGGAARI